MTDYLRDVLVLFKGASPGGGQRSVSYRVDSKPTVEWGRGAVILDLDVVADPTSPVRAKRIETVIIPMDAIERVEVSLPEPALAPAPVEEVQTDGLT